MSIYSGHLVLVRLLEPQEKKPFRDLIYYKCVKCIINMVY